MNTLLLVLDLVGTFVFALSGAGVGVKRRLDLFGVLVLHSSRELRRYHSRSHDWAVPPEAISDWRYVAVSLWQVWLPSTLLLSSTD